MPRKFLLHWKDGRKKVVEGEGITNAFAKAGHSESDLVNLEYYHMVGVPIESSGRIICGCESYRPVWKT